MKKIDAIIGMLVLVLGVHSQAFVNDGFNFNLSPWEVNGGWVQRGSGSDIEVIADNLSYTGLKTSAGNAAKLGATGTDPQIAFPDQTSGVVYASFLIKVIDVSVATSPRYSFGLSNATDPVTSGGNWTSCFYIKPSSNGYQTGINRGTADTETQWATPEYALDDVVLVVVSYDINNKISKLWVNPAQGSFGTETPPAALATAIDGNFPGANSNNIASAFLRQNATNNPIMVFDELRIGTTWAAVTHPDNTSHLNSILNNSTLKLSTNILINQVHVIGGGDITKVDFHSLDSKSVKSVIVSENSVLSVNDLPKGFLVVKLTSGNLTNTIKAVKQ
jgi:hypothetical protein